MMSIKGIYVRVCKGKISRDIARKIADVLCDGECIEITPFIYQYRNGKISFVYNVRDGYTYLYFSDEIKNMFYAIFNPRVRNMIKYFPEELKAIEEKARKIKQIIGGLL